ncbi:alkaline phosphatase [Thalassospira profundimaris]|uniref:Alkaline phosphatase n=1 Tax=Thalassospira profundimaris TaxID=502049 RepID=A0A367XFR1_9PROT|nr:choice-of-anchor I family protein [Thalassospira profundimaris]RCK52476.1 alkaline phosphatase [Thalassospira profundimaris]
MRRSIMMAGVAISGLLTACAGNGTSMDNGISLRSANQGPHRLSIAPLGEYRTHLFDEGGAEIVAYDVASKRVFAVNGGDKGIDILDISDPMNVSKVSTIALSKWGKAANSVAVHNGLVAAAVENTDKQAPGQAVFFDIDGNFKAAVKVGALPDMIKFTHDGKHVLVANEGEPNDAFDNDPEGSVEVISVPGDVTKITQADVRFARFDGLNNKKLPAGMRTANPGTSSVAQDIEPEYIAISADDRKAYVTLQENNAIAIVDIASASVSDVVGLGFKDHMVNAIDASNKDGAITIKPWPVFGMYMPDTIAGIEIEGKNYYIIANEGDSRDYKGYSEEARIADLKLDPTAFPNARELQKKENLGRLKVTTAQGDTDGDGDFDQLFSFGGRSFAVLDDQADMIFDSGDQFEQYLSAYLPKNFNSNNDENGSFDDRSDDKGPEPEGAAAGYVNGVPYAFIGLERQGGFMVYDLTNPANPQFVTYHTDRNFEGDPKQDTAGDLAPEGMLFIDAKHSPTGNAMLVVASEVSGSTRLYDLK